MRAVAGRERRDGRRQRHRVADDRRAVVVVHEHLGHGHAVDAAIDFELAGAEYRSASASRQRADREGRDANHCRKPNPAAAYDS